MKIRIVLVNVLLSVIFMYALAGRAEAQLSKIFRIPTIDTVCNGSYYLDFGADGSINDLDSSYKYINTEFGYSDRFEGGVDIDLDDVSRSLINAKYLALSNKDRSFGVALGLYDMSSDRIATPFIVTGYNISKYRVHTGVMRQDQKNQIFAGIDGRLGDKFLLKADHIEGERNVTAVGLGYNVTDRAGLTLGHIFPNAGGKGLAALELALLFSEKRGLTASVAVPDGGGDTFFSILLTHTCSYAGMKKASD
ncbi:MAG: hypothetical protein PHT33_05660 [bacterium]|nr:hypothetical protein [bacterium]